MDVLVAEIGSTTTAVNAFSLPRSGKPRFLGQGMYRTTVLEGDVREGLAGALKDLRGVLNSGPVTWGSFFATSSAAGGLVMTVHGLVHDMTVRAAKEAALGAGANIHQITSGRMRDRDLEKLARINPGIIMIAGGVDYGERETSLFNAEKIHALLTGRELSIPVVYAGNRENREDIQDIFSGYPGGLTVIPNVYPRIDELVTAPARKVIQDLFEKHITNGPGMEHIRDMVDGPVVPTPGGVMRAAQLLKDAIGDLVVFDVGGATTDVHSVTDGSDGVKQISLYAEPEAKRTVEGDLGVYINRYNILGGTGLDTLDTPGTRKVLDTLEMKPGYTAEELTTVISKLHPLPQTEAEKAAVRLLAEQALKKALERHAGRFRDLYGEGGRTRAAEGRDLTAVKYCIGTGGVLTRLDGGCELVERVLSSAPPAALYPPKETACLIDRQYIMASAGVLSKQYPAAARELLLESLGLPGRNQENEG